ncbi:hypothetical protein ABZ749_00950 [Micromonospora sp. NPDC047753]|uniref:putative phage holin n=1 Tax=Micromonospora sp. NPDC047753 TaxID=3154817 RepID=UPI0033C708FC
MRDLTTAVAAVGAAGCWYFVLVYWATTAGDWRHNPGGRHVMLFTADLGVLLTLIVAARIWPDYPGRSVVTLVAFALLVVQILWRCVLLHRAQHEPADHL